MKPFYQTSNTHTHTDTHTRAFYMFRKKVDRKNKKYKNLTPWGFDRLTSGLRARRPTTVP